MEQLKKCKNIYDIQFPIFAVAKNYERIWEEDNITSIQTASGVYVLDNKNIQGNTLGQRRLRIKNSKLYIPRTVIHNIAQLIRSTYKTFIDNNGEVFTYIKHTAVPLKYYKVKKVVDKDDGCVLHFEGISNPVKVSCGRAYGIHSVGFLVTNIGYILYEYSEAPVGDTWRKI